MEDQMNSRPAWSLRAKGMVVAVVTCVSVCATLPASASAARSTTPVAGHSAANKKALGASALGGVEETLLTKFATSIVTGVGGKVGGTAAGWVLETLLGIGNSPSAEIAKNLQDIKGQLDSISSQLSQINNNLVALNDSLTTIASLVKSQADYALYSGRVNDIAGDESVIETAQSGLALAIQTASASTVGQQQYRDELVREANSITDITTGVQAHVNHLAKLFLGENGTQSLPTLLAQVLRDSGRYPEFNDQMFYTNYINPLVENYASYVVMGMNLLVEAWHLKFPMDTNQVSAKAAVSQNWALLRAMFKVGGYPLTNSDVTTAVSSDGSVALWSLQPLSVTADFDSSQAVAWASSNSIPVPDAWLVIFKAQATKGYLQSMDFPNGMCGGFGFFPVDSCVKWDFKSGDTISQFPATWYQPSYGNVILAANGGRLATATPGTTLSWTLPSEEAFVQLVRSRGQAQPQDYLASVGFKNLSTTMMGAGAAAKPGVCNGMTLVDAALPYIATYPNIPCLTKYQFQQIPDVNPLGPAKIWTTLIATAAVPPSSYMGAGTLGSVLGVPTALCSGTGTNDASCRWLNGRWTADPAGPNANLSYAHLQGVDLADANLAGANLTGADLQGADLSRANLTNANLTDANLKGAKLDGADLTGANMTGTIR